MIACLNVNITDFILMTCDEHDGCCAKCGDITCHQNEVCDIDIDDCMPQCFHDEAKTEPCKTDERCCDEYDIDSGCCAKCGESTCYEDEVCDIDMDMCILQCFHDEAKTEPCKTD